jgi:hypothetical protein
MTKYEIVDEINKQTLENKIFIFTNTLISNNSKDIKNELYYSALNMQSEYLNDSDLISFTQIDSDEFYEAK